MSIMCVLYILRDAQFISAGANSDQDRTPNEDEAESHPEGEIDQVPREVKRPD